MPRLAFGWLLAVAFLVISLSAQAPKGAISSSGKVAGTILDSLTKRPVAGIRIQLLPTRIGAIYQETTNSQGRWEFSVPPGSYNLSIAGRPNYSTEVGYPLINIRESQIFSLQPILLDPLGWLEGKVVDDAGHAVSGAQLIALANSKIFFSRELRSRGAGVADGEGRFRFPVEPGRVFVRVTVPAVNAKGERFVTTFYPDEQTIFDATQVYIAPGTTVTGINFRLHRSPTFSRSGENFTRRRVTRTRHFVDSSL